MAGTSEKIDFNMAEEVYQEFWVRWKREKFELKVLNERFANSIKKVRLLEQHIQVLTVEVEHLRVQEETVEHYKMEMSELRRQVGTLNAERSRIEVERNNLAEERDKLKLRWEELFFKAKYSTHINPTDQPGLVPETGR